MLLGYEIGIIGSVLLFIQTEFNLSTGMLGVVASIFIPGIMSGVALTSLVIEKWERRKLIAASAWISLISLLLLTFSFSTGMLLIGRFLSGTAVGIILVVVPLYLAEIASIHERGKYISIYQLSITFGVVIGYLFSYLLAHYAAWREIFAIGIIIALLQLVASFYLIPSQIDTSKNESPRSSFMDLFRKPYRKPVIIGNVLSMLHQLTGINAVAFYAPQIFQSMYPHSKTSAILGGFILMLGNFLFTFFSLYIFDYFGRRPILLLSFLLQGVSLVLVGSLNFASHPWLVMIFLLIFIFSFSTGLGPGTWLIASEIYPLKIRNKAMGLTVIMNNIAAFIVIGSFLPLLNLIGKTTIFWTYGMIALFGVVFVFLFIPETSGKKLDEIW